MNDVQCCERSSQDFFFQRATISEIIEHEWFKTDYRPQLGLDNDENLTSTSADANNSLEELQSSGVQVHTI